MREVSDYIVKFASEIWQIHPFSEGNTRATAVFIIKYLNSLGYKVNNEPFADHSRYFHNALVRANYNDLAEDVTVDSRFLEAFFGNLLLGENNELKNRFMHLDWGTEQDNMLSSGETEQVTEQVERLVEAIGNDELTGAELMDKLGLKHRPTFLYAYLHPAIEAGLVELTIPDKPNSRLQNALCLKTSYPSQRPWSNDVRILIVTFISSRTIAISSASGMLHGNTWIV